MKFGAPNSGVIHFEQAVVDVMNSHRQLGHRDVEAGGVILGRLLLGSDVIIVDEATLPGRADRRERFFFRRARRPTECHINWTWAESGGTRNYLGEWHTHPEDDPAPSPKDIENWRRISSEAQYEQPHLLFVIVGQKHIRAWMWQRGAAMPIELSVQSSDDLSNGT